MPSPVGDHATPPGQLRVRHHQTGDDGAREVTGSLSLDDVSKRFDMLEVRGGHCARSGRLRIDKLIDEHGRDMSLPDLRTILAADCEHITAGRRKDQCQVFYPQLRELKREGDESLRALGKL